MPWIAVVCLLVVGCSFDADYAGARCSDVCPSHLECRMVGGDKQCLEKRKDAAVDMPLDMMVDGNDAMPPRLDCGDPGILSSGVTVSGTTVGRTNLMQSFCGGGFQNAADAVYQITTMQPNKQLNVTITTASLSAYVINACMTGTNTPACLGGSAASNGSPITVTAANAGAYFVVVDNLVVNAMDTYMLRVTIQ